MHNNIDTHDIGSRKQTLTACTRPNTFSLVPSWMTCIWWYIACYACAWQWSICLDSRIGSFMVFVPCIAVNDAYGADIRRRCPFRRGPFCPPFHDSTYLYWYVPVSCDTTYIIELIITALNLWNGRTGQVRVYFVGRLAGPDLGSEQPFWAKVRIYSEMAILIGWRVAKYLPSF